MGTLSAHFDKDEFVCRDCGKFFIDMELVNSLEELRKIVGTPIIIIDGYRCPEHNKAVQGVSKSQHLEGKAADIRIPGLTLQQMYSAALRVMSFKYGGIGVYDSKLPFIHVDVRQQIARWSRVNGKYGEIDLLVKEVDPADADTQA
jgi:uncharacterized protein YcbK (DUF882 family)